MVLSNPFGDGCNPNNHTFNSGASCLQRKIDAQGARWGELFQALLSANSSVQSFQVDSDLNTNYGLYAYKESESEKYRLKVKTVYDPTNGGCVCPKISGRNPIESKTVNTDAYKNGLAEVNSKYNENIDTDYSCNYFIPRIDIRFCKESVTFPITSLYSDAGNNNALCAEDAGTRYAYPIFIPATASGFRSNLGYIPIAPDSKRWKCQNIKGEEFGLGAGGGEVVRLLEATSYPTFNAVIQNYLIPSLTELFPDQTKWTKDELGKTFVFFCIPSDPA